MKHQWILLLTADWTASLLRIPEMALRNITQCNSAVDSLRLGG
jgi:hypothetical protein